MRLPIDRGRSSFFASITVAMAAGATPCFGEGQLQIYNWGNYTSPALIEKFEAEYSVEVTVTEYDSNETALAKLRAGGHGFDIVGPSGSHVPIFVAEGLLLESKPSEMENFRHMDPAWVDVTFDPGRSYTVPWQWGTVGTIVNTSVYDGDINTSAVIFDPPEELRGKINVVPSMLSVMDLAIFYVGGEPCTEDAAVLNEVRDTLLRAKPHWLAMDYPTIESFTDGDFAAGVAWNGAALRARLENADLAYGYPKEGYSIWSDNLAILADAKNVENAKLFLNFVMAPENAAMISDFAKYSNGIAGSEAFMDETMKSAPEILVPEEFRDFGRPSRPCSKAAIDLYTAIWTDVLK